MPLLNYKESKTLDCTGIWDNGKKKLNVTLSKISVGVQDNENLATVEKLDIIPPPIKKKVTFTKKTDNTSGNLVISEKKAKYVEYYFNFSLVDESNAHIGELEEKLENNGSIFYYNSNPKADYSKGFDNGTILFFIFFKDRVFVYQYGSEANLDFGQGVIAEGVYIIKK